MSHEEYAKSNHKDPKESFLHSGEPEMAVLRSTAVAQLEADAVVAHRGGEPALLALDANVDQGRQRMLANVRQSLLNYSVDCELFLGGKPRSGR